MKGIAMSLTEIDVWGARVRYQTELLERYHLARCAQLLRRRNVIQLVTIASGLPAFTLLSQRMSADVWPALPYITAAVGALIAVLAVVDQIYRFSERAIEHRLAAAQYGEIANEVRSKALKLSDLERLQARIDSISVAEPQRLVLEARCHNILMRVYNFGREYEIDTRFLKRMFRRLSGNAPSGLAAQRNLDSDVEGWVKKMGIAADSH